MVRVQRGGSTRQLNVGQLAIIALLVLLCFLLGRSKTDPTEDAGRIFHAFDSVVEDPLRPQPGSAVALPAIRLQDDADSTRKIYGGKGDGKHLGGWTEIDINGISPVLWRYMMTNIGIKSIIDVGCGRGISTSWFIMNGMDTLCVEGSHDAYLNSVLPDKDKQMVEHDFSRGPYWPAKTYDAVWCVEFLEHVGRNFHKNYLPVFRKAAILFVTHSSWGGWHHVEVHNDDWWVRKYELYGFKFMPELTKEVRETARSEAMQPDTPENKAINGEKANPQNLYSVLVFFNPAVGALPEHAHLFAEPGCFDSRAADPGKRSRKCTGGTSEETPLPPEFEPLPVLPENQKLWEDHVRKFITPKA